MSGELPQSDGACAVENTPLLHTAVPGGHRYDAASESAAPPAALEAVWADRDLGWLEFNRRVLAEALDDRTPLLERVKFLAIFTSNLDEFFMKRIAVLREDLTAERQKMLAEIRAHLEPSLELQAHYFLERIVPELAAHGIHLRLWTQLTPAQRQEADRYFDTEVCAALTPLVISSSQPFPFFSNLSLSLSFRLQDDAADEIVDARVKVPDDLPQWVPLTAGVAEHERVFVRLHELIRENAHKLYPGKRLSAPTLFRLTRDAEVPMKEHGRHDMRELVREQIRQRRYEPVVRIEFAPDADEHMRQLLQQRFGLSHAEVYDLRGELDYRSLFQIAALNAPGLRDAAFEPVVPLCVGDETDIFSAVRSADVLVHHPYESFDESIERFIREAAEDPHTISIKMTVYRVGDDTPFVRSLIKAAESGKQVACVIELTARFDEARNLHWAAELERAGAHVTVGNVGFKTHAKVALVVRKEETGLRSYSHIGTGNYHVRTARQYTDVGLLTCDPTITADVVKLFHHLTGRSDAPGFAQLLVAPAGMRQRFLDLIAGEAEHRRAGRPARIVAKMNQVEDSTVIAALCDASRAGVPIDLLVRGFCCLRPGIAGVSESIRVRSIIGRFLEHSRIFYFAAGHEDPLDGQFFIGSADWMTRNLSHRVEVITPVSARSARERLWEILTISLNDRRQAWIMGSDGHYTQLQPSDEVDGPAWQGTQQTLIDLSQRRSCAREAYPG
jgi:polyphosphate kinase